MWSYRQSTGGLYRGADYHGKGYSGRDWGKNNPAAEAVPGIGPIPAGKWRMVDIYDSTRVGPRAIVLHAMDGHDDDFEDFTGQRRGAFRIHGDSVRLPGTASHGCIILPRAIRLEMWQSGDHILEVVP